MNGLAGVMVFASLGVAFYAILTLPSWLLASMNRGSLWRLRDAVFDARLDGRLPEDPAVDDLLGRIERLIIVLPQVSALQFWWLERKLDVQPVADDYEWRFELGDDAAMDEQVLFVQMQYHLARIVWRHYLMCSWSGLLWKLPRNLKDVPSLMPKQGFHAVRGRVESPAEQLAQAGPVDHVERETYFEEEWELMARVERLPTPTRSRQAGEVDDELLAAAG